MIYELEINWLCPVIWSIITVRKTCNSFISSYFSLRLNLIEQCLVIYGCKSFYFAEGAVAGAAAGVVAESALYPLDTIKTRLQAGEMLELKLCVLVNYV